jgi:hypothetical protein
MLSGNKELKFMSLLMAIVGIGLDEVFLKRTLRLSKNPVINAPITYPPQA